jgi:serine/threonine protein kinase
MIGTRIGRYQLSEEMERCAFGVLHKASTQDLGSPPVAVEVLRAEIASEPTFLTELQRPQPHLFLPGHPAWLRVRDILVDAEVSAVAIDPPGGPSLRKLLVSGPLSILESTRILQEMLDALRHAHGLGIPHLALLPENIFLGAGGRVFVAELGLGWAARNLLSDASASAFLHPRYRAPEIGTGGLSHLADLYTAGLVAWELLVGTPACPAAETGAAADWHLSKAPLDPRERLPTCPAWLAEIVVGLTQADPAGRPSTAEAALQALKAGATTATPAASRPYGNTGARHRGPRKLGGPDPWMMGVTEAPDAPSPLGVAPLIAPERPITTEVDLTSVPETTLGAPPPTDVASPPTETAAPIPDAAPTVKVDLGLPMTEAPLQATEAPPEPAAPEADPTDVPEPPAAPPEPGPVAVEDPPAPDPEPPAESEPTAAATATPAEPEASAEDAWPPPGDEPDEGEDHLAPAAASPRSKAPLLFIVPLLCIALVVLFFLFKGNQPEPSRSRPEARTPPTAAPMATAPPTTVSPPETPLTAAPPPDPKPEPTPVVGTAPPQTPPTATPTSPAEAREVKASSATNPNQIPPKDVRVTATTPSTPKATAPPPTGASPWGATASSEPSSSASSSAQPWGAIAGATTGTFSVSSDPVGATIFANNQSLGQTPLQGRELGPGKYEIRIEKDGHRPARRLIELAAGQRIDLGKVELQFIGTAPVTGVVSVTAPNAAPGSRLFIDGSLTGTLPVTVQLTEGAHTFKVQAPDGTYFTQKRETRFDGSGRPVNVELSPR